MKIKLPEVSSVLQVGAGRGFIFDQKVRPPGWGRPEVEKLGPLLRPFVVHRRIITAAHCLPHFPEPHAWESHDQVYPNLLGVLGEEPSVYGLLVFADPIGDIAVLGSPDCQEMYEQSAAYEELVEPLKAIPLGNAETGKGWMLSLDKPYRWEPTTLNTDYGSLLSGPTLGGQSGSPILNEEGQAVGVVSIGTMSENGKELVSSQNNGPQPMPKLNLPAWMLRRFR
jgi:hypothetical protein